MKQYKEIEYLKEKSKWVWRATLKIHSDSPETRLASSLSPVEIFTVLYYGGILKHYPNDPMNVNRDRFIISKGHGSICFYPILADLGFITKKQLGMVCKNGSYLGSIPDPNTPGYETLNGSLGHGLGVACGIAIHLKRIKNKSKVYVLVGDGELNEGSVWEAVMFAGHHKLDNLILIVDKNGLCMLDYCRNVINLSPLKNKFTSFGWNAINVAGHDVKKLQSVFQNLKRCKNKMPHVVIAETVKGRGVECLENDVLCHIKSVSPNSINKLLKE